MKYEKDQNDHARGDDSQYQRPLATASKNVLGPTENACDCYAHCWTRGDYGVGPWEPPDAMLCDCQSVRWDRRNVPLLRGYKTRQPIPGTPERHEHEFSDYSTCRICGLTEAAIVGCHHCDDADSVKNGRCWWCLQPVVR